MERNISIQKHQTDKYSVKYIRCYTVLLHNRWTVRSAGPSDGFKLLQTVENDLIWFHLILNSELY